MRLSIHHLIIGCCALMLWSQVEARGSYRSRLPSHQQCSTCHSNPGGGGARNVFGRAFDDNGRLWNAALCTLDSDSDGFSNGVELGDADCSWSAGQEQRVTISQPGDDEDRPPEDPVDPPADMGVGEPDGGEGQGHADAGVDQEPVQHGLRGEYFSRGIGGDGPECTSNQPAEDFVRIDPIIDFSWADGPPHAAQGARIDTWCYNGFKVRWTAWLTVPETGDYYFYMYGNDYADLYIDGRLIANSRRNGWNGDRIHLTAGESVPFRVDHTEGSAGAAVYLLWVPPWEPEMPDIGWLMGEDIQAMFGEQFVSRSHRLGILVPPEVFTPREPGIEGEPLLQLLAHNPLMSEGRIACYWTGVCTLDSAGFYVYSNEPLPHDVNVQLQFAGSAQENVHYELGFYKSLGTLGPQIYNREVGLSLKQHYGFGEFSLSQLDNQLVEGQRDIEVLLLPGAGYQVGENNRVVIRILDDEVPAGEPGNALGGRVRGLGADEWAIIWVQRPDGGVLVSDIVFEDGVFILDSLPEAELELHGVVDLNINGAVDPGEPRFGPEPISLIIPPTRLDLVLDFDRGILVEAEGGPVAEAEPDAERDPPVEDDSPENADPEAGPAEEGDDSAEEQPDADPEGAEEEPAGASPPPQEADEQPAPDEGGDPEKFAWVTEKGDIDTAQGAKGTDKSRREQGASRQIADGILPDRRGGIRRADRRSPQIDQRSLRGPSAESTAWGRGAEPKGGDPEVEHPGDEKWRSERSAGCATVPNEPSANWMLLALLGLLRRRPR